VFGLGTRRFGTLHFGVEAWNIDLSLACRACQPWMATFILLMHSFKWQYIDLRLRTHFAAENILVNDFKACSFVT
jgi:hypothetical protein